MYANTVSPPFSGNTWDPEINMSPRNDFQKKSVQSALYTIQVARDTKIRRDSKNFLIQQLIEGGFEVRSPNSPRRITSKMMQQVFWRTANRMKPLDFEIFGSGRPDVNRRIVTAGVGTVMKRGGYERSLRDKGGVYQKAVMWGDGFMHFGANPDPEADFPIVYSPVSNSNIYTDTYSTGMRSGGIGRAVRKCAIIFSMSWATACERYPKIKKIAAPGKVPRDTGYFKELERTYLQTNKMYDMIEICHFYDLDAPGYVCFAGPTCAVLEELKGKSYPFTLGKKLEPYIPILQFICMPSTDGFYNHGLGDMFFDIAMLYSQLLNMGLNHAADNIDPFTLLGLPKGETAKIFNSMRAAGEMRQAGKRPIIPVEYDPSTPAGNKIQMEAMTTQNMANELEAMMVALTKEVSRLGINLDDVQYGPDVTAHQIVAEQQSSNSFTDQIQEYNASEEEFAVITAMDMIEKLVGSKDSTPLNLIGEFKSIDDKTGQAITIKPDQVTLGAVRDELKKFNYWVDINARTGSQPSGILEEARTEKLISMVAPGSKAQNKLLAALSAAGKVDLSIEDFEPPAPQAPPGAQPQQPGANNPGNPSPIAAAPAPSPLSLPSLPMATAAH